MIQLASVFRNNVRRLMAERGWSQVEFAKRLDVSQPYASQLISACEIRAYQQSIRSRQYLEFNPTSCCESPTKKISNAYDGTISNC